MVWEKAWHIVYIQDILSREEVIYAPFTIYTKLSPLKSETEIIRFSYSSKTLYML